MEVQGLLAFELVSSGSLRNISDKYAQTTSLSSSQAQKDQYKM